jgi:aspartyl/glutamyl-tRNA(Asn/Gln) amidotransferase C subunit
MATAEEVKKLAALARIRVGDAELEKFTSEFDAILAYIGQLEKLELPKGAVAKPPLHNVMREDGEPHAAGAYTEKLAGQFPARSSFAEATEDKEGVYLEVKQIITHE